MPNRPADGHSTRKKRRRFTKPQMPERRHQGGGRDRPPPTEEQSSISKGVRGKLWLFGRHAVEAALLNPRRTSHKLLGTNEALERLDPDAGARAPDVQHVERTDLDQKLGDHVVHQGLALAVAPLPSLSLEKACVDETDAANDEVGTTVLVLDRINDPHNLGAILRSAVAFNVRAVVLPHRQSAELGGATAKAASGALDMIPIVEVANLSRALAQLKDLGYWRAGLDGGAEQTISEAPAFDKLALVLGAEGTGIRRLVGEHCDLMLKLPISERMESLNVSVACGIALFGLSNMSRG